MVELLGRHKPVIGMVHLAALPGSPFYVGLTDRQILDAAQRDVEVLAAAGFDAISFSNEGDRPYQTEVPRETVALYTRLVFELSRGLPMPFGCGLLIDPFATLAAARAVGADFARITYGVTAGTFGLLHDSAGEVLRYRQRIGAGGLPLFVNLSPHFATSLDARPPAEVARTCWAMTQPDAIQVHGAGAGAAADLDVVREVKAALPAVPVIVASGVTLESLPAALAAGDGLIVGSAIKEEGRTWAAVDPGRARAFMERAKSLRSGEA
ncbi:MAG TPA: BtpA/SgcQ family protein [Chloroflexota bacterium]|nr:BtpA/SgcQ family protein [Chloroflexota bacterium]